MSDEQTINIRDGTGFAVSGARVVVNEGKRFATSATQKVESKVKHAKRELEARKAGQSDFAGLSLEELKESKDTARIKTEKKLLGKEKTSVFMNDGTVISEKGGKRKVYKAKPQSENFAFIVGKDQGLFRDSFTNRVGLDGKKKADLYTGRFSKASKKIGRKQVELFEAERKLTEGKKLRRSKSQTLRSRRELVRNGISFIEDSLRDEDNYGMEALAKTRQGATGAIDFLADTSGKVKDVKTAYQMHKIKAQKKAQKKLIKKEYAKAFRQAFAEGGAKAVAVRSRQQLQMVAKKKLEEIRKKVISLVKRFGIGAAIALFVFIFVFAMFAFMGSTTTGTVAVSAYPASIESIEASENYYTQLEQNLMLQVTNFNSTNYPGYDDYEVVGDFNEIGHNPYDLSNYLNAMYGAYTYDSNMQANLDTIFSQMYMVWTTTENYTVNVWDANHLNDDGTYGAWVPEGRTRLQLHIDRRELYEVTYPNLTTTEQRGLYELYQASGGLTQMFQSPIEENWVENIVRSYGDTYNPQTGTTQTHLGVDVSATLGTNVYAGANGTVTATGWDDTFGYYVYITDNYGQQIRYSHLQSYNVSVGQTVTKDSQIAKVGNSGSEANGLATLHIETLDANGNYRNPIFAIGCYNSEIESTSSVRTGYGSYASGAARYTTTGQTQTSGAGSGGTGGGGGYSYSNQTRADFGLPEEYDDPEVEALVSYAEQFLGMPYKLGGHDPSGMDCCNFVSYVLRNSGYYDTPQRGVDGLYSLCYEIDASEVQPGDLVFFVNTTGKGPDILSHVGLYVGNGVMIHCGNPCKFGRINIQYWQPYFKCYARLIR